MSLPKLLSAISATAAVAVLVAGAFIPSARYVCLSCGLLACTGVIVFSLFELSRRQWRLETRNEVASRQRFMALACEMHSARVILDRFPECTIPSSSFSIRFQNLHAIVDLLDSRKPSLVVEFGSGMSTICVASWMRQEGRGRIVSIEHDENWAAITRCYIHSHGLEDFADIVVAPLKPAPADRDATEWYDLGDAMKELRDIDMVIVDGPPAGERRTQLARLPAVPRLIAQLSDDCVVILDDAARPGETRVVQRWIELYPQFKVRHVKGVTGMAILDRPALKRPTPESMLHCEQA